MTVLPIVERELRVGARNPLFYRGRFMVPMVGAIMFLFIAYGLHEGAPSQMMGKTLLYLCFGVVFGICLFGGVHATADTISREKREGTLGFLFLTDLKGYDIVIGKLVSSSVGGVYSLFGILPVISVIFLMGGVDWGTVLRLVVTCGNTLFLSLSAGLLASVWCVQEQKARGTAAILIMGAILGGPLVGLGWHWINGSLEGVTRTAWAPFLLSSPIFGFASSVSPLSMGGWTAFLISNVLIHATGWIFLGLACWLAPRTWQERASSKPESNARAWWRNLVYGKGQELAAWRTARLDINAIHWLTDRDRWKGRLVWALWWSVVGGFVGVVLYFGKEALNPGTAVALVLILNAAMKLSMAGEACRWLAQDRQNGVLELVLTTTLSTEEILEGQRLSLRRLYLKPFMASAVVQVLFMMVCLAAENVDGESVGLAFYGMLVSLGVMAVDYKALGWVGMWKGLSAMPVEKARQQTVSAVLLMPWMLFYLGMIFLGCFLGPETFFFLWPAAMLGVAGWWINRSKTRLREEFRTRAMERYSPIQKMPFWKRVGQILDDLVTPESKPER